MCVWNGFCDVLTFKSNKNNSKTPRKNRKGKFAYFVIYFVLDLPVQGASEGFYRLSHAFIVVRMQEQPEK